ncbi:MAG: helix-turn-helix transcriptional regulator [Clostridia bacterium]|nr:helix-turn-helix transcriptional regulator [Clostridia bacterium]
MTIHENLRQLRLQRGLTQEQVAGQLNVTRQALSSYESGRTRPDIDTLMKLAAIYETDLEGILYGTDGRLAWSNRARKTAKVLLFLLPALATLYSGIYWVTQSFFPLSSGHLSLQQEVIWQTRIRLSYVCEFMEGLLLTLATIGFLALVILLAAGRASFPPQTKLRYAALLTAGVMLPPLAFCLLLRLHPINLALTPFRVVCRMFLYLLLDLLIGRLQKRTC